MMSTTATPGGGADLAETHISVVLFLGDRAYKFPKPVRFAFLDQSTVERRAALCRKELELNRRLAPDVYLGTGELRSDAERGEPDPGGAEPCLVMRRMPADRRLSTIVRSDSGREEVRAVARLLARFHAAADRGPAVDAAATPDAVRALWQDNLDELLGVGAATGSAATIEHVGGLVDRYLSGRSELFAQRIERGFVCDGHGDLLADDIFCLDDGPRILDCLAFADRLRHGDVLLDVAFLAMDLERLGAPDLAEQLLADYTEFTDEHHPASLAHHYVAYRALVRAKIAWLGADAASDPTERERAIDAARRLLGRCLDHLDAARVRLVMVGGAPGTGKSTLARGIGEAKGWAVLRTDEIRKELAGRRWTDRRDTELDAGIYSEESDERTYRTVLDRARTLLGAGESVVLDGSWGDRRHRAAVAELAEVTGSDLVPLWCRVSEPTALERVRRRAAQGGDPSDVDERRLRDLTERFDHWPEAVAVDAERPADELLAGVVTTLDRSGFCP